MSSQRRALVSFLIDDLDVEVPTDTRLVEIVEAAGADITFGCRNGTCGTCRVRIVEGMENLSPRTAEERDFLSALNASSEERLGCQFRVCGNVVIDYIGS
jgi:ferredoxin